MKKIVKIIIIMILVMGVTACTSNTKLEEIANNINNSETVTNLKEYGYKIKASASKDKIIIKTDTGEEKRKAEFQLKGDILSNENLSEDVLLETILLINGVGISYGYQDGELSKNINTFPQEYQQYTLEKEGIALLIEDEKISLKIDLSKKIPLIDMNEFYLTTDDFDMIKQIVVDKETGNQNGKIGNIAYDVFIGEETSTITIGQEEHLADSAYKSILSALEVMYGEETKNHFQEIYPKFVDGKTEIEAYTIETNYHPEDQENSVFKDTKVVHITIDKNMIKD